MLEYCEKVTILGRSCTWVSVDREHGHPATLFGSCCKLIEEGEQSLGCQVILVLLGITKQSL
jgi:hypothetical protein